MSVRTTLRLGSALLGLTLVVAACSGSTDATGNGGSSSTLASDNGDPGLVAPASAAPTFDLGSLLSPEPTPAGTPTTAPSSPALGTQASPNPPGTTPGPISTTKASSLLSQVDSLLKQVDGELSNADAAANNPGE